MRWTKANGIIFSILLSIASSGCAHRVAEVSFQIPFRPPLPSIPADSLSCLTDQTYHALVIRDVSQAEHIIVLEGLLEKFGGQKAPVDQGLVGRESLPTR